MRGMGKGTHKRLSKAIAAQAETAAEVQTEHTDSVCARCGCVGMTVVTRIVPGQLPVTVSFCNEECAVRPWTCPKCDGRKVPMHTKWCTVTHPEVRRAWEEHRAAREAQL